MVRFSRYLFTYKLWYLPPLFTNTLQLVLKLILSQRKQLIWHDYKFKHKAGVFSLFIFGKYIFSYLDSLLQHEKMSLYRKCKIFNCFMCLCRFLIYRVGRKVSEWVLITFNKIYFKILYTF